LKILGLDLGIHMGWALRKDNGSIQSGEQDYSVGPFDGAGVMYLRFRLWLREYSSVDLVVFEGVRAHSAGAVLAAHKYGAFLGVLQSTCTELSIPHTSYGVTTIKKYWTGKGNAKKDAMILAANERGFNPGTDNEADALAVLHMGIDEFLIE